MLVSRTRVKTRKKREKNKNASESTHSVIRPYMCISSILKVMCESECKKYGCDHPKIRFSGKTVFFSVHNHIFCYVLYCKNGTRALIKI